MRYTGNDVAELSGQIIKLPPSQRSIREEVSVKKTLFCKEIMKSLTKREHTRCYSNPELRRIEGYTSTILFKRVCSPAQTISINSLWKTTCLNLALRNTLRNSTGGKLIVWILCKQAHSLCKADNNITRLNTSSFVQYSDVFWLPLLHKKEKNHIDKP